MYEVKGNNIKLTRGDAFVTLVEIFQDEEQTEPYVPTEHDSIRFAMKLHYSDEEPLILKTIPNETLILRLEPKDTKDLDLLTYVYDVKITLESGDPDTFISGNLTLMPEVD